MKIRSFILAAVILAGCKQPQPPPQQAQATPTPLPTATAPTFFSSPTPVATPTPTPAPVVNLSPEFATTFSVEIHPGDPAGTSSAALSDIKNNLGVGAIRTDYSPTQFDYSWITTALSDGLRIDFITPYIPLNSILDDAGVWAQNYATLVAAGAAKYPGQLWEIVNEPDHDENLSEMQLSAAQYITLVKAVVPAIRAADPTATIISGGTSLFDPIWMDSVSSIFPLLDGVSVHPYGTPPTQFGLVVNALYADYKKPVYVTEWGEGPPSPGDITQAVSALKGNVPFFNLYEYKTQTPDAGPYGIVDDPAAYAEYQAAIK